MKCGIDHQEGRSKGRQVLHIHHRNVKCSPCKGMGLVGFFSLMFVECFLIFTCRETMLNKAIENFSSSVQGLPDRRSVPSVGGGETSFQYRQRFMFLSRPHLPLSVSRVEKRKSRLFIVKKLGIVLFLPIGEGTSQESQRL